MTRARLDLLVAAVLLAAALAVLLWRLDLAAGATPERRAAAPLLVCPLGYHPAAPLDVAAPPRRLTPPRRAPAPG